jgi:hypothetical protein
VFCFCENDVFGDILVFEEIELKTVERMNHDENPVLFPNLVENTDHSVIHFLFHDDDECIGGLKNLLDVIQVINHMVDILSAKCFG